MMIALHILEHNCPVGTGITPRKPNKLIFPKSLFVQHLIVIPDPRVTVNEYCLGSMADFATDQFGPDVKWHLAVRIEQPIAGCDVAPHPFLKLKSRLHDNATKARMQDTCPPRSPQRRSQCEARMQGEGGGAE